MRRTRSATGLVWYAAVTKADVRDPLLAKGLPWLWHIMGCAQCCWASAANPQQALKAALSLSTNARTSGCR